MDSLSPLLEHVDTAEHHNASDHRIQILVPSGLILQIQNVPTIIYLKIKLMLSLYLFFQQELFKTAITPPLLFGCLFVHLLIFPLCLMSTLSVLNTWKPAI